MAGRACAGDVQGLRTWHHDCTPSRIVEDMACRGVQGGSTRANTSGYDLSTTISSILYYEGPPFFFTIPTYLATLPVPKIIRVFPVLAIAIWITVTSAAAWGGDCNPSFHYHRLLRIVFMGAGAVFPASLHTYVAPRLLLPRAFS